MDIMNALKKTVESVRDWTNEKLENKVKEKYKIDSFIKKKIRK